MAGIKKILLFLLGGIMIGDAGSGGIDDENAITEAADLEKKSSGSIQSGNLLEVTTQAGSPISQILEIDADTDVAVTSLTDLTTDEFFLRMEGIFQKTYDAKSEDAARKVIQENQIFLEQVPEGVLNGGEKAMDQLVSRKCFGFFLYDGLWKPTERVLEAVRACMKDLKAGIAIKDLGLYLLKKAADDFDVSAFLAELGHL